MTDKTTPPDWALREGAKRADLHFVTDERMRWAYETNPAYRALCDMIAKHERPPIDRKLICAREACARSHDALWKGAAKSYREGLNDDIAPVQEAVRAIELWEEGYGKENQT